MDEKKNKIEQREIRKNYYYFATDEKRVNTERKRRENLR